MKKRISHFMLLVLANIIAAAAFAQTNTISGTVENSNNKEKISAVSVTVKGGTDGTFTDDKGNFKFTIGHSLPVTLVFSSVGFETQEATVSDASQKVDIAFKPASSLGQEVVVSATRSSIKSLESPVSIERMGRAQV